MATGYRIFNVTLARRVAITPSLLRCVFSGEEVALMKREAPDQRIKLLFPAREGTETAMPVSDDWYQQYRALSKDIRPIMRTYTLRALRPREQEIDVEFALHGMTGPASRWAQTARPGSRLQIVAPNGLVEQDSGGYEWPEALSPRRVLLIADETALPAAMGILEQLARCAQPPSVQAFFDVPLRADEQPTGCAGAQVHWIHRERDTVRGEGLLNAVRRHVDIPACARRDGQQISESFDEETRLWTRAGHPREFSAWVAGESSTVKRLRRCLLDEYHLDSSAASFMAYWAQGKAG
ncbi:siderophore-interacting protein [Erwinia sp. HR93]|uniref:siderophore-interacting protein n=1 Tax=Erwinia sp. HR93 TaxID=3094840 RepID=UPI002ADEF52F|nr:siderophore-interacting protein [Erwinia sp. HR93]MEA1063035.1 siderophore-interacting protein [Erwinia sp. HR93]